MLNIPKLFLQQSVKIEKVKGKNKYGDPEYEEAFTIENIKVETKTTFSGSGSDRKISKETTLFIYLSSQAKDFVIDDSFLEARVTDSEQNQFILKEYIQNKNPIKDDIWSYEVRLI